MNPKISRRKEIIKKCRNLLDRKWTDEREINKPNLFF